jgi:hypothetical protein
MGAAHSALLGPRRPAIQNSLAQNEMVACALSAFFDRKGVSSSVLVDADYIERVGVMDLA